MNFKTLKTIGLVLGLTLATAHAADSQYWHEFENAHKINPQLTLMQHIQNLSVFTESDNPTQRQSKKEALAYFFATGGKNGFRKQPATEKEQEILIQAATVMTLLHYEDPKTPVLDLGDVRKSYGLDTNDPTVQHHLAHVHAVMGYAFCAHAYANPENSNLNIWALKQAIQNVYLNPVLKLPTTFNRDYWSNLLINGVQKKPLKTIGKVFTKEELPLEDQDVQAIQGFLNLALFAKISKRLNLSNGTYIQRTEDGRISTNLIGGLVVSPSININGLSLDISQTDDEMAQALRPHGITITSTSD